MTSPAPGHFIKICGLSDAESLAALAGASHAGFVAVAASPRYRPLGTLAGLAQKARPAVKTVVLVSDPADDLLVRLANADAFDAVQFHGRETPERLARARALFPEGTAIWKAVGIGTAADLTAALAYDNVVDLLLFDARPPQGAERTGGHGAVFDWTLLTGWRGKSPWLLAGGLTPDTVGAAIEAAAPVPGFAGVDVSSGVEARRGQKDPALMTRFIAAARRAMERPLQEKEPQ